LVSPNLDTGKELRYQLYMGPGEPPWRSGRLKVERTGLNQNQIPIPSVHCSFIISTEPLRLLYKQLIWKGPGHVSRMKGGPWSRAFLERPLVSQVDKEFQDS